PEVLGRGLEGLLEGALDLAVDVPDQALQLAHRALRVLALRLQLLDVLASLLVLALGERVDGADLAAAALQPLQPAVDPGAVLLAQLLFRRPDLLTEALRDRGELPRRLGTA